MRIKWFWRSSTGQAPAAPVDLSVAAAPVDLSVAAADADAGGSLHDLASGLIQLAVDRATPDEAMRVLSGLRPRTWLRLDVELRSLRHWFGTDVGWRRITDPARTGSDPLALLLTACFDDGRLRQRAVMTPLMSHDQRLLPILLIRTADWAKQVRDDAVRVLPTNQQIRTGCCEEPAWRSRCGTGSAANRPSQR
jgi:hypothetical protein